MANDLSERDWQIAVSGGQWSKGKSAPGFCPTGPWLVTTDELDADDVRLRSLVNGEPRQDSRTSDLIFDIDHHRLAPQPVPRARAGRPRAHRHPRGRGAVRAASPTSPPGDVVELEIDGLGRQRQQYVASNRSSTDPEGAIP